MIYNYTALVNS